MFLTSDFISGFCGEDEKAHQVYLVVSVGTKSLGDYRLDQASEVRFLLCVPIQHARGFGLTLFWINCFLENQSIS